MKLKHLLFLSVLFTLIAAGAPARAQVTSFTYQGQLRASGAPANGNYDLIFEFFNTNGVSTQIGPIITNFNVTVTNGLFTTVLANLPTSNFNSTNLALGLAVRTAGSSNSFTPLLPFQPLTPVPYAVVAGNVTGTVAASQVTGSLVLSQLPGNLVTNNSSNVVLSGTFSGNGAGLTNLAQTVVQSNVTPILNMIWIPPGTFVMGSPSAELNRSADEGPQTVVTLTNGFWMGHHTVTQGEYANVLTNNPSTFTGNLNMPVETVTWTNASNFCATLTTRELAAGRLTAGWSYRLPTEAEWEYACRALTTTAFYWGNDTTYTNINNYAWWGNNAAVSTQPVAQKLPNPWGLVDMSGNVFQWCQDWYAAAYAGGNLTNPTGPTNGSVRVLRGGSWGQNAYICRSAKRATGSPGLGYNNAGFRVVLAPN